MKFFKSTILAVAALSAVAFTACSDDDQYNPGDPSDGVYFEGTGETNIQILPTETHTTLTVYRRGYTEAATYKIDITGENSDLFFLPNEVSFAEGATSADFVIGYNAAELETNVEYTVEIKFAEGTPVCAYGTDRTTLVIILQKDYTEFMTMKQVFGQGGRDCTYFFDALLYQVFPSPTSGMPISARVNKNNKNDVQVMIENWPFKPDPDDYDSEEEYEEDLELVRLYIDVDLSKELHYTATGELAGYACYIPYNTHTYVGDGNGNEILMCDIYTYLTQSPDGYSHIGGVDESNVNRVEGASTYNPNTGYFDLYTVYYTTDGTSTDIWALDYEGAQVSGFINYNPGITYEGTMTNADGNAAYALIDYTLDAGVEKISLIASATASVEDLENEIVSESSLCTVVNGDESATVSGTARVQLDGSGNYTVVAMTYGEQEWHGPYTVTFSTLDGLPENADIHWPVVGSAYMVDGWILPAYLKSLGVTDTEAAAWEVEVRESDKTPGMYRLVSPWTSSTCPIASYNTNKKSTDIFVDATNPDCVKIAAQYSGFTQSDGKAIYIANYAGTTAGVNMTDEQIMATNFNSELSGDILQVMPSFYAYTESIAASASNYHSSNRVPYTTTLMFDITTSAAKAKKAVINERRKNGIKSKKNFGPIEVVFRDKM